MFKIDIYHKKNIFFLSILIFLSPLGVIIPDFLNSGDAWGEWDLETVKSHVGYEPKKMSALNNFWKAPIPDYSFSFSSESLFSKSFSYGFSALAGTLLCISMTFLIFKIVKKNDTKN